MLERAREIAAIGAREKSGNGGASREDQFHDVDVAVVGEEPAEIREDAAGG